MAEKGKFYLTGLGILMQGITFTPGEKAVLDRLCRAASESDAQYFDAVRVIRSDLRASRELDRVIHTMRRLGKGPELEAYYDREHRVYR